MVENWQLIECPAKTRKVDLFLVGIKNEVYNSDFDAEAGAYAVLRVLLSHILQGEIEKISKVLPYEIGMLWDEATLA